MGQGISIRVGSAEAYEQVLMNTNCCFPNNMGSLKVTLTQAKLSPPPALSLETSPPEETHSCALELAMLLVPLGGFIPVKYTLAVVQKCRFRSFVHEGRAARLYQMDLSEQLQQQGGVLEVQVPLPANFSPSYSSSFCTVWTELQVHFYDEKMRYLKFFTKLTL